MFAARKPNIHPQTGGFRFNCLAAQVLITKAMVALVYAQEHILSGSCNELFSCWWFNLFSIYMLSLPQNGFVCTSSVILIFLTQNGNAAFVAVNHQRSSDPDHSRHTLRGHSGTKPPRQDKKTGIKSDYFWQGPEILNIMTVHRAAESDRSITSNNKDVFAQRPQDRRQTGPGQTMVQLLDRW